jgi:hypothetical protein
MLVYCFIYVVRSPVEVRCQDRLTYLVSLHLTRGFSPQVSGSAVMFRVFKSRTADCTSAGVRTVLWTANSIKVFLGFPQSYSQYSVGTARFSWGPLSVIKILSLGCPCRHKTAQGVHVTGWLVLQPSRTTPRILRWESLKTYKNDKIDQNFSFFLYYIFKHCASHHATLLILTQFILPTSYSLQQDERALLCAQ